MNLDENLTINNLIKERDEWKKKYEEQNNEYLRIKKELESLENNKVKKEHVKDEFENIKKDILIKYEYLKSKYDYLIVKVDILNIEKEEEIKKRHVLEKNIIRQNKEIEGYKKILEKIKNMNLLNKDNMDEKVHLNMSILINDNILLRDIINVNNQLNDINNKVNNKLKEKYNIVKKKLKETNEKLIKLNDAFIRLHKGYMDHNNMRESFLEKTMDMNKILNEELTHKKGQEIIALESKKEIENYTINTILSNYYELKYYLNNKSKNVIFKYMNILFHNIQKNTESTCKKDIRNFILYEMQNLYNSRENYDQELDKIKKSILKGEDIIQMKKKINEYINMSLLQTAKIKENSLDIFLQNNLNYLNIFELIYYNIKLVNDIFESFSITLFFILFIFDAYFKNILKNIKDTEYLSNIETNSLHFYIYFMFSLSNFLLIILKYINIIQNYDEDIYLKLFYTDYIFYIFSLIKDALEQYINKIKINLFTPSFDYSLLDLLTERLNFIYDSFFSMDEKNKFTENKKEKKENTKNDTSENLYITSFELLCLINFIIGSCILVITDTKKNYDITNIIDDFKLEIEISIKCSEIVKLLKISNKIMDYNFNITTYTFDLYAFKKLAIAYKNFIVGSENDDIKNNFINNVEETNNKILTELIRIEENINDLAYNITPIKNICVFNICDKYINMFNHIINNINNKEDKYSFEKQTLQFKKLENELNELKKINDIYKRKINILTIKEEKCNKLEVDLDILKKEKNEYINIIEILRKNKEQNLNEIANITKQYNDTKNKYTELMKIYESKKKYFNNSKHSEILNIDTYYMRKIINNLYYENFLTKINKNYYLYDEKLNTYNQFYQDQMRLDIQTEKQNNIENNLDLNDNQKDMNIMLKQILGDEIYFTEKSDKCLFDDIYNFELIKSKIDKYNIKYFNHNLYQTISCNNYKKLKINTNLQNEKYNKIYIILEDCKKIKNQIIQELFNMSISTNIEKEIKKNQEVYKNIQFKIVQLKNLIKNFKDTYIVKEKKDDLQHIMTISFDKKVDSKINETKKINETQKSNSTLKINETQKTKVTEKINISDNVLKKSQNADKIILNDQSFTYLIKNVLNL